LRGATLDGADLRDADITLATLAGAPFETLPSPRPGFRRTVSREFASLWLSRRVTGPLAKAGDVLFSEAVTHATENIGGTDAHGILVELKTSGAERVGKAADTADEWLTALTFIRGAAGKEEAIKRELLSLTAPTRAEAGSIQYDLYQSVNRANEFMRFEVWRNPEALELHKASPYLKASFERRKDQGWMTEITLWKRVNQ